MALAKPVGNPARGERASHRRLALHEYALMASIGVSALMLRTAPNVVQAVGLVAWVGIFCALMWIVDQRWRNRSNGSPL